MTTPTHAAQLGPGIGVDIDAVHNRHEGITYLCGPMTGYPQHNHKAFNAMARELRAHGVVVFSPAENGLPANAAWSTHMRVDLRMLMGCDRVATLPGIEASKGAQLELHIARELGMPVHEADKLLAWLQRNGGDSHQATTFHTHIKP